MIPRSQLVLDQRSDHPGRESKAWDQYCHEIEHYRAVSEIEHYRAVSEIVHYQAVSEIEHYQAVSLPVMERQMQEFGEIF